MYAAAIRVLNEEGGGLSPLLVLRAIPDSMPLSNAAATLELALAGVMHMRRQTQVMFCAFKGLTVDDLDPYHHSWPWPAG